MREIGRRHIGRRAALCGLLGLGAASAMTGAALAQNLPPTTAVPRAGGEHRHLLRHQA